MAGIKLEGFQGLIPRSSNRLLPPMAATEAKNTKLLNGEIRGFRAMREEADFSAGSVTPVRRAFRVVDNAGVNPDTWLTFDSQNVDIVRSPIINDSYDRYYWAGDGAPKMNTYARVYAGSDPYLLGVPTPTNALSITPPAGSDETRAYVYTFVSPYGEEGPPSPPTLATGNAGTWALSNMDTTIPDSSSRPSGFKINVYRTVTGGTSANFYYVGQFDLGDSSYNDAEATDDVAQNSLLESTDWIEPPDDLEGFVVMPNGYLVGWAGRRLVFSEPYRPHAWPAAYELSTEFPIVGLVVWGSTLVIGTKSQPYFGQGTTPLAFTMQKLDAVEPCLSRRGMVATTAGAYYPSINGLVLANSSGAQIITQDILTKEEWEDYSPSDVFAAQLGLQYIAFNSETTGFIFNPTEPQTKLIELEGFADVAGIETDRYSGNVLILANDRAVEWDPSSSERLSWRWQGKLIQTQKPISFGAFRANFKTGEEDVSADILSYYGGYNTSLFAAVPSGSAPVTDGDTNFGDVVFLAKFQGSDAATAYTELSDNAAVATFNADAQLDTAQYKFGTSSLLLDGTGDYVSFPDIDGYDIADNTVDWTVEGWVYLNALPTGSFSTDPGFCIVSQWGSSAGDNAWALELAHDSFGYRVRGRFDNTSEVGTISLSTGQWYHVAMCNVGGTLSIYFDGTRYVSGGSFTGGVTSSQPIRVGSLQGTDSFFNGWIEGVRVTIGTARYNGSTYTVPTAEFEENGNVPPEYQRGLNTLNGHVLGGSPAQADGLVSGWTEPETRQPLGGSLIYPEDFLSFQTLAVRVQVKVGASGEVKYDKVIYDENVYRLPAGFKSDLWQFNFYGNTDLYSFQVATTPRALKEV